MHVRRRGGVRGRLEEHQEGGQVWLHDADGDVFEGDFKDDKMEGKGKYTYTDGGVYEGDFKDDKMEGKSTNTRTLTGACTR